MKNRYYILLICLTLSSATLNSCSESKTNDTVHQETEIVFADFDQFPSIPFLNLEFNTLVEDLKQDIEALNYEKQSDNIYVNTSDSTSVILNDEANLTSFKVYLKSTFYLTHYQQLFDKLSNHSTQHIGTSDFAEMTFNIETQPFKLTFFRTRKFIRISYQIQSKRLA